MQQETVLRIFLIGLSKAHPVIGQVPLLPSSSFPSSSSSSILLHPPPPPPQVNLATARYTAWSAELASKLPRSWLARRTAVTGVPYLGNNPDLLLLHDDSTIAVLDKNKDLPEPSAKVGCTFIRIYAI